MDFFPRFAQTKNTMNMRKVLLLILLLFGCMDTMSFANEPYDIFVVNDSLYTE